jgi:hypothetical protein
MKLIEYARQPYPLRLNKWAVMLSISLFISFFMVVFQPFGLQNMESGWKTLLLAGYGMVTFMVLFINEIVLPPIIPGIFREERWTVFREVIWLVWIVVTISVGNYLYSGVFSIVQWIGIKGLLIFMGFTFAIAIIPITVVTVYSHNRQLKKNLLASQELNELIGGQEPGRVQDNSKLLITSQNMKEKLDIPVSNLICIESEGNYVNTWYLEEGKIVRLIIRNTLKNIESQIEKAGILFKCHRAYIVNLSYIERIKGNSQGYRLMLKYMDREIPVSRNYSKSFKKAIGRNA